MGEKKASVNSDRFNYNEQKLKICDLRLQHYSTYEIAKKMNCSHQYVSRVLGDLRPGSSDFFECPYPSLRSWAKRGTETIDEIAEAIGEDPVCLRAIICTAGDEKMPSEIAEKLSKYTGVSVQKLVVNERTVRERREVPQEPKRGAFKKVIYGEVVKYLRAHNMTMTVLAQKCDKPYPLVYKCITQPVAAPASHPVCAAIAAVMEKPVEMVFHL